MSRRFFRDPAVFEAFKNLLLPRIFETARRLEQQVRIWIARLRHGRGSLSVRHLPAGVPRRANALEPPIQIFGTDASEPNIRRRAWAAYTRTSIAARCLAGASAPLLQQDRARATRSQARARSVHLRAPEPVLTIRRFRVWT